MSHQPQDYPFVQIHYDLMPTSIKLIPVWVALFIVFLVIRSSRRRAREQRWAAPTFKSKHVRIGTGERSFEVEVSQAKGMAFHRLGNGGTDYNNPVPGDAFRVAKTGLTEPFWVSLDVDTHTQETHHAASPDTFSGTHYGNGQISGTLHKGHDAFTTSEQIPTGWVSVTFGEVDAPAGSSRPWVQHTMSLSLAEAEDLFQWLLRHPDHFQVSIRGGDNYNGGTRWCKIRDRFDRRKH